MLTGTSETTTTVYERGELFIQKLLLNSINKATKDSVALLLIIFKGLRCLHFLGLFLDSYNVFFSNFIVSPHCIRRASCAAAAACKKFQSSSSSSSSSTAVEDVEMSTTAVGLGRKKQTDKWTHFNLTEMEKKAECIILSKRK